MKPPDPFMVTSPTQVDPSTRSILSQLMFGDLSTIPSYNSQVVRNTLNDNSGWLVLILGLIALGMARR